MNGMMNQDRMNKRQMMEWIMCLGFCADDMKLYLDTHTDDMEALEYYNQCMELLKNARKKYENAFGPLILQCADRLSSWNWNTTPMPWEGEC